jgi:hypothetical protein
MDKKVGKSIKFNFHPNRWEDRKHFIEKTDDKGRKRRYMVGISSGLKTDSHGEHMTEKCIKSFMDQAHSGQILLYPDNHGIKESEDIGYMSTAKILDDGDWYTEYGLWDEKDDIGPVKAERINTLWKQVCGSPPYDRPRQKGFSIEGIIPEEAIIYDQTGDIDRGVMDDILLDGVVLCPRPAYKDSVVTAIYKAFGEVTPERKESLKVSLVENLERENLENMFYKKRWELQDALESTIEKIMLKKNNNKQRELEFVFDEYKEIMIQLITRSSTIFAGEQTEEGTIQTVEAAPIGKGQKSRVTLYKSLLKELKKLDNVYSKGKK